MIPSLREKEKREMASSLILIPKWSFGKAKAGEG